MVLSVKVTQDNIVKKKIYIVGSLLSLYRGNLFLYFPLHHILPLLHLFPFLVVAGLHISPIISMKPRSPHAHSCSGSSFAPTPTPPPSCCSGHVSGDAPIKKRVSLAQSGSGVPGSRQEEAGPLGELEVWEWT